jgi:hypothetical protein
MLLFTAVLPCQAGQAYLCLPAIIVGIELVSSSLTVHVSCADSHALENLDFHALD